jgi:glycosyltransferase involved in cell wall biosynthesis
MVEAMGMGCVPVASDDAGAREAVDDGETGLIVRPGDEGQLTDALLRLVRQPELRRNLAVRAKRRARTSFTAAKMADRVADHYDWLLSEAGQ